MHNHRMHGKYLQRYAYLYNASLGTADITVQSKGYNGLQCFPGLCVSLQNTTSQFMALQT